MAAKWIFLNLKRFDIPASLGGVNRLCPPEAWGTQIVGRTEGTLRAYPDVRFVFFLPEAHLIPARAACAPDSPIELGCQGVYRYDVGTGGAYGAYTTHRPASAMAALGCRWALIGHWEERRDKLDMTGGDAARVNAILAEEVRCAQAAGLAVLLCVGETEAERPRREQVLMRQVEQGLADCDPSRVVLAYEPVWAIGPGRTPHGAEEAQAGCALLSRITGRDVVYGGGLDVESAARLGVGDTASGGLFALTRFTGEIGFYPDEFLMIVKAFVGGDSE